MTNLENFRKANESIRRGDIFFVDLPLDKDTSVQGGCRPCIVVQNDNGNKASPNVIVFPLTSKQKQQIPTHILINAGEAGLKKNSTVMAENPVTVPKERLKYYIGRANSQLMGEINNAIMISFGIIDIDKSLCVC